MDQKGHALTIKALSDDGKGSAVFSTLNVVDKDGDVTLKGAFGSQKAKLVAAHDWKMAPMGTVEIRESGDDVIADFRFNMGMTSAQEWYKSLKDQHDHGVPQEWSYGFDVLDSSYGQHEGKSVRFLKAMKVLEVSPVMIGAGMNTRLLNIKGGKTLEDHGTAVLAAVKDYAERCEEIRKQRDGKGKSLSTAAVEKLLLLQSQFKSLTLSLDELLKAGPDQMSGLTESEQLALLDLDIRARR